MGKFDIIKQSIYKWRYFIGYGLVALGLVVALIITGTHIPGGLSQAEMNSVITSSNTNFKDFWSLNAINLPYRLLQHVSVSLFGVSILSVKLPSMILAFLSAIGLVLLLRQWFKPNIGILASLIAITTSQFMFIGQNGTPDVLYLFWPVWLIYAASLVPNIQKYRKLTIASFFILAALSLYTPLSIYILIVIAGAIIIHPHLRYLIKQISKFDMVIGIVSILVLLSPLILMIGRKPELVLNLIGIPTSWPNLSANLGTLATTYFSFAHPGGVTFITPFFELGSSLLVLLGLYFVFQNRVTAKSYVVIIWTICLLPVLALNPMASTVTLLPLVLLLASGLNGLLAHWYGLFPRNPYARVGGLIPVIILVVVLVSSGINRYVFSYRYNPTLARSFSYDLRLLPTDTKNLLVAPDEQAFYRVVAKYNKRLVITSSPSGSDFVATHKAKASFPDYMVKRVITNSFSTDSDRYYLYEKKK